MEKNIGMSAMTLIVALTISSAGCGGSGSNVSSSGPGEVGSPDVTVPVGVLLGSYQNPTNSTPATVIYGVVTSGGVITPSSMSIFLNEIHQHGTAELFGTVGDQLRANDKGGRMVVTTASTGVYTVDIYNSAAFPPYEFTVKDGEAGGEIANTMQYAEPNPGTAGVFDITLLNLVSPT